MNKLQKYSLAILVLAVVICAAEPPKYRHRIAARKLQPLRQRPVVVQKRILARQETVTPYPTADELKPEVPFEEGNTPDEVYGPPDETYGPPEIDQTPADQLPSEEDPEEFAANPEAEEFPPAQETVEEQIARLITRGKPKKKNISSRIVLKKKTRNSQRLVIAPAQIRTARSQVLPVSLPISAPQQFYLSNQPFAYSGRYQAW